MPFDTFKELIEKIPSHSWIAGLGGIALHLNQVRKGAPFKIGMFIINICLAIFVGFLVDLVIPINFSDRWHNAIIAVSGFLSYPILDALETKGFPLILKKLLGEQK